jgi:hypothetical protein
MKSGNGLSKDKHNGTYILVEGPSWGDAEFYGRWLLDAPKSINFCSRRREKIRIFVRRSML